jgi:PIN domain nuclease of toxin-antitoxin system
MSRYVTDTHALYWHLTNDPRLSPVARQVFREADAGLHQILVPGIVLIEMVYLVEKGRLDADLVEQAFILLDTIGGSYAVASLNQDTARAMRDVPHSAIPDMPDRVIVAVAHQLKLPLITRDAKIHDAGVVPLIW